MNVYVYKGFGTSLVMRGMYSVANSSTSNIARSLTADRRFELTLLDSGTGVVTDIQHTDICKIEVNGLTLYGFIDSVTIDKAKPGLVVCSIGLGAEGIGGFDGDLLIDNLNTQPNIISYVALQFNKLYQDNPRPIDIVGTGSGYIRASDNLLPFGQIVRQLLSQGFKEYITIANGRLQIEFKSRARNYNIRVEDVLTYKLELDKSIPTRLMLYNGDNLSVSPIIVYLKKNGTIGTYDSNIVTPITTKCEKVSYDEFSLDTAIKILALETYNNSVDITFRSTNDGTYESRYAYDYILEANPFNTLGTKITIYMGDKQLISIVNEVELREGVVRLVFGLSKDRIFDII